MVLEDGYGDSQGEAMKIKVWTQYKHLQIVAGTQKRYSEAPE